MIPVKAPDTCFNFKDENLNECSTLTSISIRLGELAKLVNADEQVQNQQRFKGDENVM